MTKILVRAASAKDAAKIADIFTSSRGLLTFLPSLHTRDEDARFIEHNVLKTCEVFVAEQDGRIVGFMAVKDDWLDHLYVAPDRLGGGVGSLLLNRAKRQNSRLQLWCFEQNQTARQFYEKRGFDFAERTDGSTNEEKCPDVRYVWKRA